MRLAQKSWSEIDWDNDVKEKAKKFRRRIRGAIATGNTDKAFEHADKMLNSHYECLLAVRKVTEKRRERTTPGIDGLTYQTDAEKMALVQRLREDSGAEPNPLKVAVVPKKDGGTRELAIPTVFDRARQTLLAAVLTVLNDHRFGPGSFGVGGKRRGVHGAYGAICKHLYGRHMFALRTDIRNCFGEISRSPLLDSLVGPQKLKEQAHMFLDSGLWVDGEVVHSDRGAPQGMPLSPLLVNLALSGLEAEVMSLLPDDVGAKPLFIRYVDDIIILHRDPEVIKECYLNLGDCLEEYELLLNREKTSIGPTEVGTGSREQTKVGGFDFLGYNLTQYPAPDGNSRLDTYVELLPTERPSGEWIHAEAGRMIKAVKGTALVVDGYGYRGWDNHELTPNAAD